MPAIATPARPQHRDPFSVSHPAKAQDSCASEPNPQSHKSTLTPNPLPASFPILPAVLDGAQRSLKQPRPAEGRRVLSINSHKTKSSSKSQKPNAFERAKLAVLKHQYEFGGVFTLHIDLLQNPQDVMDNLSRAVQKTTKQPFDFYAVAVLDYQTRERFPLPHIHALIRCRPGDATWQALRPAWPAGRPTPCRR